MRDVVTSLAVAVCLATTGCLIDRSALVGSDTGRLELDARAATDDAGLDLDAAPELDAHRELDAPIDPDAARADVGSDAGPCPDGPTGTTTCPFTTLADVTGVATGTYEFAMGGLRFQALVDDGDTGGWVLVASADDTTTGRVALSRTTTGPVARQSHHVFAPEVVAALPDVREVRIDSSPGSVVMASVRSDHAYVLDQLRRYRSLHAVVAETGATRWRGDDAARMTSTCANVEPESLDRLVFQTCGAAGDNLHWGPDPSDLDDPPDRLNSWVYRSMRRDRLNLWVRH